MRAIEFHSRLAAELQRFVALRRAGGSDYQAQCDCCCTSIDS